MRNLTHHPTGPAQESPHAGEFMCALEIGEYAMWNKTKTGWLMALADSDDSAWGYVPDFYSDIRACEVRKGQIIVDSDTWGKHLYKNHAPAPGDGVAFYHSTKAKFAKPDKYGRRPRISLVGELIEVRTGGGMVDWITVVVDKKVLAGLEQYPIVKSEENEEMFLECGIGTGAIASF